MLFYQSLNFFFIPGISNTNLINKIKTGKCEWNVYTIGGAQRFPLGVAVCLCVCVCVQLNREGTVQGHQRTQLFYLIVPFDSSHSVAL